MDIKKLMDESLMELSSTPVFEGGFGTFSGQGVAQKNIAEEYGKTIGEEKTRNLRKNVYSDLMSSLSDEQGNISTDPKKLLSTTGNIQDSAALQKMVKENFGMKEEKFKNAANLRKVVELIGYLKKVPMADKAGLDATLTGISNWLQDKSNLTETGENVETYQTLSDQMISALAKESQGGNPSNLDMNMLLSSLPEVSGFSADSRSGALKKILRPLVNMHVKHPKAGIIDSEIMNWPGYGEALEILKGTIPEEEYIKLLGKKVKN